MNGRECYIGLSDELSADGATLAEFDDQYVEAAHAFAATLDLPWPPVGDVDITLDLVARAEWRARRIIEEAA